MNASLLPPRDEILAVMERIYRFRMTTTSGGNVSVREDNGDVWITPARVDKGGLRRADMVCARPDGTTEGLHRPSSELPFHQAIYAARPDARAVVHAHPTALVAFSMTRQTPNTRLFPQARHVCGEVGFAPYALPGSAGLGANIARAFAQGHDCVVLENHGVVTAGPTLAEAFQRFEALEFAAQTQIAARRLAAPRFLTDPQLELAQRREQAWRDLPAARADAAERELRRQLAEFVRRGVRQRLLISTEGSFSARLGGEAFLVTPSRQDRYLLESPDIVRVEGDAREAGKTPSRASPAHQAIYRRHPWVGAIVFAHPVYATAHSVTGVRLDARAIPESYLLLREIAQAPYGWQHRELDRLAELVSRRQPIALLENDGALVLGTDPLDAFDRLEVLEATAEATVQGQALGPAAPMPEAVIDELRRAFFRDEG